MDYCLYWFPGQCLPVLCPLQLIGKAQSSFHDSLLQLCGHHLLHELAERLQWCDRYQWWLRPQLHHLYQLPEGVRGFNTEVGGGSGGDCVAVEINSLSQYGPGVRHPWPGAQSHHMAGSSSLQPTPGCSLCCWGSHGIIHPSPPAW